MKGTIICLFVLVFFSVPATLWAKGPTTKIIIKGADLAQPIEIKDSNTLHSLRIWGGPGFTINGVPDTQTSLAIWSRGSVAEPSKELTEYEIAIYAKHYDEPEERIVYVVSYRYDSGSKQGYIYIPRTQLNMSTVTRGVEGNWFYAAPDFDKVLAPLIEKGRKSVPPTR